MKGKLITLEGIEGSGKTTQIKMLLRYLKKKRRQVICLREPGGVTISERIRTLLLDRRMKNMSVRCEVLLYMAARTQLMEEVLAPALKEGKIVICDRFLDSTIAYQGYGHVMDIDFIKELGNFATKGIKPDITFLLDLDVKAGFLRFKGVKDRIEQRPYAYHQRVRQGFLLLAQEEPQRIKVIKANRSQEEIQNEIRHEINTILLT